MKIRISDWEKTFSYIKMTNEDYSECIIKSLQKIEDNKYKTRNNVSKCVWQKGKSESSLKQKYA